MGIKDEDIIQTLTGGGIALDRWFSLDSHLVGYFDDTGRLMAKIIEDDALAAAASEMLRKRGQTHQVVAGGRPI
ncbi:hypothetical protein [Burkholderia ubonensis]|uniref:Uncharacterized protein n=1 Tax=Burkholderia ubonensis TaxID=101571 RepID=A0AA40R600_9BURK|nr:hypothetical protein [Burkholderia ubonensis]KVD02199.1 hypothetical protein WI79_16990 [Burkholderia ubonensis]KVQ95664.1 hypothetical protein WK08_08605 [Burkholderia ubonensis]KWZ53812.1 hypothetical protein WK57_33315 [Burkholderia ubonensis]